VTTPGEPLKLADREAKLRLSGQVTLTDIEAGLRVEEGLVRVESGRTDITLRKRMAYWLLVLFSVNTAGALAIVFFVGFGLMNLSEKVIMSVLGATVVEAAAMLFTVTKYLFPARTSQDK
jgi:hypothetical protein